MYDAFKKKELNFIGHYFGKETTFRKYCD